jgi:predicted metal-binding protein
MQCTKCFRCLEFSDFSFKNEKEKIYYLHCNDCRQKIIEYQQYNKEKTKEEYNIVKTSNIVLCDCGVSYIAFRKYHMVRHQSTKKHQSYLDQIK